jgi:hypothetical protein
MSSIQQVSEFEQAPHGFLLHIFNVSHLAPVSKVHSAVVYTSSEIVQAVASTLGKFETCDMSAFFDGLGKQRSISHTVCVQSLQKGTVSRSIRVVLDALTQPLHLYPITPTKEEAVMPKIHAACAATAVPRTASSFLEQADRTLGERGKQYDKNGEQERSMGRTVAAFNAVTGLKLTEQQGWAFMLTLKLVRGADKPHADSALDAVGYSALYAESVQAAIDKQGTPEPAMLCKVSDDLPYLYGKLAEAYKLLELELRTAKDAARELRSANKLLQEEKGAIRKELHSMAAEREQLSKLLDSHAVEYGRLQQKHSLLQQEHTAAKYDKLQTVMQQSMKDCR